ncbi:DUF402 domain-containing protein [Mycoplasmopsis adleri]|uniref:DUF402 domain-containing protein n=1 Tax=Mycoplasmopsis adleri TaxID=51362 RepID=UPI0038735348
MNNKRTDIFPLAGSIINVQAYKYNGSLYRQWNGVKVLRNTPKHYVLLINKTKVSEKFKSDWAYKEPVIWFMPKHSMYNGLVLLKPKQNYLYINISSKPFYEDNTIKFIDFDLDVKYYPHSGINVVDADEFKTNSELYHYPKNVKNMVWDAVNEVIQKYERGEYFFNDLVIDYYIDISRKDRSLPYNFRIEPKRRVYKKKRYKNK